MKKHTLFLCTIVTLFLFSCNNAHNDAVKSEEGIKNTVKENSPGSISTSADGYTMTANINGKEWNAAKVWINQLFDSYKGGSNCC